MVEINKKCLQSVLACTVQEHLIKVRCYNSPIKKKIRQTDSSLCATLKVISLRTPLKSKGPEKLRVAWVSTYSFCRFVLIVICSVFA